MHFPFKNCLLIIVLLISLQINWSDSSHIKYLLPFIKKGAAAAAGLATFGLGGKKIIPIPIPIPFELFPPPVIGPPLPPPFLPPQPVVIGVGKGYDRLIGPGGYIGNGGGFGGGFGGGYGGGFGGGFGGYGGGGGYGFGR